MLAYQTPIHPDDDRRYPVSEVKLFAEPLEPGGPPSLLDIQYDWANLPVPGSLKALGRRWADAGSPRHDRLNYSGVWRFRDLLPFFGDERNIVTIGEGRTHLQDADLLAREIGHQPGQLFLQYEGLNPSGSFKDNGMTAAFTHANMVGASRVACASTGNTSASLAMFSALSGIPGVVFIGSGKIAYGKLSQALDYGVKTLQVQGDFDACLAALRSIVIDHPELGIYLMNSVNPFRLEGQKSIMYRVLEGLNWEVPDWVVVPGGNLGNSSAFGKAFSELHCLGLIDRMPRLAIIQAQGADPLYQLHTEQGLRWNGGDYDQKLADDYYRLMDDQNIKANTIASAIEIGRPVNLTKALRALETMDGVVREIDDQTILEHKALVGRYGFGCEPASAASVAGARLLREQGVIGKSDRVACILTGHELKDPDATVKYHTGIDMKSAQELAPRSDPHGKNANRPIQVPDDIEAIIKAIS